MRAGAGVVERFVVGGPKVRLATTVGHWYTPSRARGEWRTDVSGRDDVDANRRELDRKAAYQRGRLARTGRHHGRSGGCASAVGSAYEEPRSTVRIFGEAFCATCNGNRKCASRRVASVSFQRGSFPPIG